MSDTVPAIGFSATINLEDSRQVVFQTHFAQDDSDETVNKLIDRVMKIADRQKARYALPGLIEEQRKLTDEIAQYTEDSARTEADFERAQASLDVQLAALFDQETHVRTEDEQAFRSSGRSGTYNPKGATKANIDRIRTAAEEVAETKKKNTAERDAAIENLNISMKRRQARIDLLDEMIGEKLREVGD